MACAFRGKGPMTAEQVLTQGVLELHPKGFGFLRNPARHYTAQPSDPYVPAPLVTRFSLREGLLVSGPVEPPRKGNGPRLTGIEHIEGADPQLFARREWD